MGVGLPLARLHARQLGGGLQLGSLPGVGGNGGGGAGFAGGAGADGELILEF